MHVVRFDGDVCSKQFDSPAAFEHEWRFYRDFPEWTPRLIKLQPEVLTITMERGQSTHGTPGTVAELAELIRDMVRMNVHHRDLHPGNITYTSDGIRIIDWETAVVAKGKSYDLYGPVDVPVPVQHGGLLPQWWDSNDRGSIKNKWGVSIPDWLK